MLVFGFVMKKKVKTTLHVLCLFEKNPCTSGYKKNQSNSLTINTVIKEKANIFLMSELRLAAHSFYLPSLC